ncbi:MAG: 4-alpha-glucanotransferase [Xanthomonadales bacterium]|nr:4-alpha-glucanotransferase [Xanthomonadales bacterium]
MVLPVQEPSADQACPSILPAKKMAGIGIHFSSLPGPYGIGDIGDRALKFVDTLASMGLSVWQFLPTGPTAYGDSPYQPLSAFAGNEMLIGIEPLLRQGLLLKTEAEVLTRLPVQSVDYGLLIPRKQKVLARVAERFHATASSLLKTEYEDFLALNDAAWLDDYAIYRILKTMHGEKPWPEWGKPFVRREKDALEKVKNDNYQAIQHVKIIQFLFTNQWRTLKQYAGEAGVQLFGDIPIYIALDSADAWAHPEILLIDEAGKPSHVAGVPPDYFSTDGQLWGNPLYDWRFHEANGYRWWIERVRHASNHADLVRVDHFRGFESYWAVEFGAGTARVGEWLPGPGDGLFQAMHSALGSLPIVAEDLGVITPAVNRLRLQYRIPGMKVLQFETADPEFNPDDIDSNCVCYTGTHDNDTTVGWFHGSDQDNRPRQEILDTQRNVLQLTGGTAETIHRDMIRLAFDCPARLAIAPMQDFLGLGSEARLNIPGTTMNNWRWRLREEQLTPALRESVARMTGKSSRV